MILFSSRSLAFLLAGVLILWLVLIGLWLDGKSELSQAQLVYAFNLAGITGLLPCLLHFVLKYKKFWKNSLMVVIAIMIWRVAYFPVLVLAGYVATLGEATTIAILNTSVVYPYLLISVAVMNGLSFLVAAIITDGVLLSVFYNKRSRNSIYNHKSKTNLLLIGSLATVAIPLAVMAIGVSFTQPADWHAIPDTSSLDDKPLPEATLPEMNPYFTALEADNLSWQHKSLFKAAAITYDLVPEKTQWSQVVKGTLEKEFVLTKEVSTAFCTKVHFRAFMTAQPFLNGNKSIEEL